MKNTVVLISFLLFACGQKQAEITGDEKLKIESEAKRISDSLSAAINASINMAIEGSGKIVGSWYYDEDGDKMEGTTDYWAETSAKEQLRFKFPYDGGVTATLTVRYRKKENDVMLRVSKGQFIGSGFEGQRIRVKFDDQKPENYSCNPPSDGSSETLFIQNATKFISKLKKAKALIIEAEFYENGVHQMEFDVTGLKWDH